MWPLPRTLSLVAARASHLVLVSERSLEVWTLSLCLQSSLPLFTGDVEIESPVPACWMVS